MFRFPINPMISIALKEANRVAKTSVDRRYHTLIQQRPLLVLYFYEQYLNYQCHYSIFLWKGY